VTDLGTGTASLGVLVPLGRPRLSLDTKPDGREVVRLQVWDGELRLDLSVTDLRLYSDDGATPDAVKVREVAQRLDRGVPALLCVGLTRPFASRPNDAPVHWLQVNNIHLADDPCWRLVPGEVGPSGRTPVGVGGALDEREEALPF
jgi:hypothetical protein